MKKELIITLLTSALLVSCGTKQSSTNSSSLNNSSVSTSSEIKESTSSSSNSSLSSSSSSSSSTIYNEVESENLKLFMYGDLYLNGMRTIYAELSKEYDDEEIVWESSNEEIVSATGREGLSAECLVTAHSYGVAYIKASLKEYPDIYTIKKFEIKKGEAMPKELFNSIKGSATLTTKDQYISVDASRKETITKEENLEVIYEENDATNNYTDAYQMTIKNKKGEVTKEYKYVRDENKKQYVAEEYLDYRNNVRASAIEVDGERIYWDFSTYFNPFQDSSNVTNLDFETFDGGKTYHFVSYYTYMDNLVVSLYLSNFSPDAMWFEVEDGNITLNSFIEPYNSQTSSSYKYARRVTTEFSNLGNSVIDHLTPYETKNYHSKMQDAIDEVKKNNYTVNYTITFKDDDTKIGYQYKYTDNAIDEIIYNNDTQTYHAGYYKVDDSKFVTYEYEEDLDKLTFIKTHEKNWETSSLYPTFDFAVQVFDQVSDNEFITYEDHALLLSRCITLNEVYLFALQNNGKATLSLNEDGSLNIISSTFYMDEEEVEIKATFTNIGSTTVGIDFSKGEYQALPTNWKEANSNLYEELVEWGIDEVVPYMYIKQNYEGYTGINGSMYAVNYVYFNTNLFNDEESRDEFITNYQNLLLENGFVEDGINELSGFKVYTKDGYSIGVGIETKRQGINYDLVETLRAQIIISSPFIVEAPCA